MATRNCTTQTPVFEFKTVSVSVLGSDLPQEEKKKKRMREAQQNEVRRRARTGLLLSWARLDSDRNLLAGQAALLLLLMLYGLCAQSATCYVHFIKIKINGRVLLF